MDYQFVSLPSVDKSSDCYLLIESHHSCKRSPSLKAQPSLLHLALELTNRAPTQGESVTGVVNQVHFCLLFVSFQRFALIKLVVIRMNKSPKAKILHESSHFQLK